MKILSIEYWKKILKDKRSKQWLIICLIGIFLILYLGMYTSPKVYLKTDIRPVTEKDFNMFVKYNKEVPTEKKTRKNCRLFRVDLQIKSPFLFVRNVKVQEDPLSLYIDNKTYLDKTANKFQGLGSYGASDNSHHTIDSIDVYFDGITDKKVFDFFGDYKIEITWLDLLNGKHKVCYYLKDYYEMNEE